MKGKLAHIDCTAVFFALYVAGRTQASIGEEYGVTQTVVGRYLRRHQDWETTTRGYGSSNQWPSSRVADVLRRYAAGDSVGCVARAVGCNKRKVKAVLAEHAVLIRPQGVAQRGKYNPSYNGGRAKVGKYWYLLRPEHPHATQKGYVAEHRLVMEAHLGRYLLPAEVVHHKDKNTRNNDLSNLQLFASNGAHLKSELTGQCPRWSPEGRARLDRARRDRRR